MDVPPLPSGLIPLDDQWSWLEAMLFEHFLAQLPPDGVDIRFDANPALTSTD